MTTLTDARTCQYPGGDMHRIMCGWCRLRLPRLADAPSSSALFQRSQIEASAPYGAPPDLPWRTSPLGRNARLMVDPHSHENQCTPIPTRRIPRNGRPAQRKGGQ